MEADDSYDKLRWLLGIVFMIRAVSATWQMRNDAAARHIYGTSA